MTHTVYKITPESCKTNNFSLLALAMWKHQSVDAGFELYLVDSKMVYLEEDCLDEYLKSNGDEKCGCVFMVMEGGLKEFEAFMLGQVKECLEDDLALACFEETLKAETLKLA